MSETLAPPVDAFIRTLGPVLGRIAQENATRSERAASDVALEAWNVAAAFVDVDGLHTDEELEALVATFSPHFESMPRFAQPGDIRKARLVADHAGWLDTPSLLFEVLLADDHKHGSANAAVYYEGVLAIAHAVCALDAYPSHVEMQALDRFRSMLLTSMDHWSVGRPGAPGAAGVPVAGPAAGPGGPDRPEPSPARPLETVLAELDALVGLEPVKAEVRLVTNLLRVQALRRARDLPVVEGSRHLVFTGNPGTGKTTVARLLAEIYRSLGVVTKGQLIETDRSRLVAGFVGQTALQVREVVDQAAGGVLLIDEAYALARGDQRDFGQEAIDTLVKLMEDHRDDLVVIAAGYPEEMATFIESNPGLGSRFPRTIHFPDYTTDELVEVFLGMCRAASYTCDDESTAAARRWLAAQPRDRGFGNARLVRNLFEATIGRQANRIVTLEAPTVDDLCVLTPGDVGVPPGDANGDSQGAGPPA